MALSEKIQSVYLYDKKTYFNLIFHNYWTIINLNLDRQVSNNFLSYFELTHSVYQVIHKLYKKHYVH